jgi:phenylpropionate dioxygenase-like ring-hydroxylating dioxygenase large terminal subunit
MSDEIEEHDAPLLPTREVDGAGLPAPADRPPQQPGGQPGETQGERPGDRPGERPPLVHSLSRGRFSVVRPTAQWYVVASAGELPSRPGARPLQRTLLGLPLVLFRDGEGRAAALLDRCPHRNVPLSLGEVVEGQLQCTYHGWRFDGTGACRFIPSRRGDSAARARNALSYPVRELDGFIWVYPTPGAEPKDEPYRFRLLDEPGYTVVRRVVEAPGTLHATLENALDVPHTQFLHRGLFRAKSRDLAITAVVRRRADRVEAEYIGEPRPPGLVGRILSPSGGVVTHFDRFLLPCVAEVEYRIGSENHILVMAAMTPVDDFVTHIYAVVAFRMRIPGFLLRPFLLPIALKIFSQDAEILAKQTETTRRFGGEQFAATEIDVLGRHIWRLLRAAERGDVAVPDGNPVLHEERIELVV